MSFLADAATIARRELYRYRRERAFLFGQIALPLVAVAVVGFGLNRAIGPVGDVDRGVDYASFLAAGLLVLSISSGAIGGGFTLIQDVQRGFLRPILVAPVSRASIVVGKIAARLLLTIGVVGVLVALLSAFTSVRLAHPIAALVVLAALTFGFVALGILGALRLGGLESFRLVSVLATVPLYLLSGIFFPLATLPPALHALALANPLTYAVDLFRWGVTDLHELPLWLDAAVVVLLALVPTALAARAFGK